MGKTSQWLGEPARSGAPHQCGRVTRERARLSAEEYATTLLMTIRLRLPATQQETRHVVSSILMLISRQWFVRGPLCPLFAFMGHYFGIFIYSSRPSLNTIYRWNPKCQKICPRKWHTITTPTNDLMSVGTRFVQVLDCNTAGWLHASEQLHIHGLGWIVNLPLQHNGHLCVNDTLQGLT